MALGIVPIIYCEDVDGLKCDEVVANVAVDLQAIKLIFVTNVGGVFYPRDTLLRQLSLEQVHNLLKNKAVTGAMRDKLEASINACKRGVERVHIIPGEEGSIIRELFTCDGMGTMIYSKKPYEQVRKAEGEEIHVITEILRTAISKSFFDLAVLTEAIENFWVFAVDEDIQGCMHLTDHPECEAIEISCLAVTSEYENSDALKRLLQHALNYATLKKQKRVFLNSERNIPWLPLYPWFAQLGFSKSSHPKGENSLEKTGKTSWVCEM
jgi:amino-acid N-acetyltransferase